VNKSNKKYSLGKLGKEFLEWRERVPVAKIPTGVAKKGAGEKRIPFAHLANSVPVYLTLTQLIRESDKTKGKVLDIGCGTGRSIAFVKENMGKKDMKYWAVDYAKACIDYAKAQYGDRYGINYSQHDGQDIPFESGMFDFIISSHVLEHIPRGGEKKYFAEISRLLKKGGVAVIGTPNRRYNQDLFHANPEDEPEYRLVLPHHHEYGRLELGALLKANNWFSSFEINQTYNKINRKLMKESIGKIKPREGWLNQIKFRCYQVLRKNPRLQDIMAKWGTEYVLRKMKVNYDDLIGATDYITGSKASDIGDDFIIIAAK